MQRQRSIRQSGPGRIASAPMITDGALASQCVDWMESVPAMHGQTSYASSYSMNGSSSASRISMVPQPNVLPTPPTQPSPGPFGAPAARRGPLRPPAPSTTSDGSRDFFILPASNACNPRLATSHPNGSTPWQTSRINPPSLAAAAAAAALNHSLSGNPATLYGDAGMCSAAAAVVPGGPPVSYLETPSCPPAGGVPDPAHLRLSTSCPGGGVASCGTPAPPPPPPPPLMTTLPTAPTTSTSSSVRFGPGRVMQRSASMHSYMPYMSSPSGRYRGPPAAPLPPSPVQPDIWSTAATAPPPPPSGDGCEGHTRAGWRLSRTAGGDADGPTEATYPVGYFAGDGGMLGASSGAGAKEGGQAAEDWACRQQQLESGPCNRLARQASSSPETRPVLGGAGACASLPRRGLTGDIRKRAAAAAAAGGFVHRGIPRSPPGVLRTPTKRTASSIGPFPGAPLTSFAGAAASGSPLGAAVRLPHPLTTVAPYTAAAPARRRSRSAGGAGAGQAGAGCRPAVSPVSPHGSSAGSAAAVVAAATHRRLTLSSIRNLAQLRDTVAEDSSLSPKHKQNLLHMIEGALHEEEEQQQQHGELLTQSTTRAQQEWTRPMPTLQPQSQPQAQPHTQPQCQPQQPQTGFAGPVHHPQQMPEPVTGPKVHPFNGNGSSSYGNSYSQPWMAVGPTHGSMTSSTAAWGLSNHQPTMTDPSKVPKGVPELTAQQPKPEFFRTAGSASAPPTGAAASRAVSATASLGAGAAAAVGGPDRVISYCSFRTISSSSGNGCAAPPATTAAFANGAVDDLDGSRGCASNASCSRSSSNGTGKGSPSGLHEPAAATRAGVATAADSNPGTPLNFAGGASPPAEPGPPFLRSSQRSQSVTFDPAQPLPYMYGMLASAEGPLAATQSCPPHGCFSTPPWQGRGRPAADAGSGSGSGGSFAPSPGGWTSTAQQPPLPLPLPLEHTQQRILSQLQPPTLPLPSPAPPQPGAPRGQVPQHQVPGIQVPQPVPLQPQDPPGSSESPLPTPTCGPPSPSSSLTPPEYAAGRPSTPSPSEPSEPAPLPTCALPARIDGPRAARRSSASLPVPPLDRSAASAPAAVVAPGGGGVPVADQCRHPGEFVRAATADFCSSGADSGSCPTSGAADWVAAGGAFPATVPPPPPPPPPPQHPPFPQQEPVFGSPLPGFPFGPGAVPVRAPAAAAAASAAAAGSSSACDDGAGFAGMFAEPEMPDVDLDVDGDVGGEGLDPLGDMLRCFLDDSGMLAVPLAGVSEPMEGYLDGMMLDEAAAGDELS